MPNPQPNLQQEKDELRGRARVAREKARAEGGDEAPDAVARHLWSLVRPRSRGEMLAGYWAIGSEMDVRPAMCDLERLGHPLCLPAVVKRNSPLVFRQWAEGDPLEDAAHGTSEPAADAPEVRPVIMLVPGLAFDGAGFRLGYGLGYYDRTISALRSRSGEGAGAGARAREGEGGGLLAIGVAYAAQLIEAVPREDHDQPLDLIVTEKGIFVPGA